MFRDFNSIWVAGTAYTDAWMIGKLKSTIQPAPRTWWETTMISLAIVAQWNFDDSVAIARLGSLARCSAILADYESVRRRARRGGARQQVVVFIRAAYAAHPARPVAHSHHRDN